MIVRPELCCDLRRPLLMHGIGIGVEEMDDERLAAGLLEAHYRRPKLGLVERHAHGAAGFDTLSHLQPQIARNDRHENAGHPIGVRPGPAAKFDDIAKAARRDHAGLRQPPLQHGVGGRRRAVHDKVDPVHRKAGFGQRGDHPDGLVFRGGRRLGDVHLATVAPVDQDQVRESAADIDAGDHAATACANFLNHAPNPKCAA
jgi:hypothetical protein